MALNTALLKKICEVGSPSGHEDDVRALIAEEVKPYADDIRTDALGNLIVHKKGAGPKMMLAGHMDQIGFMVTFIDDEGFLRFSNIGGFDPFMLVSRRVRFINGTVGVIRSEYIENFKQDFSMQKLYIDIGAKNKADAEKHVKIGDVCVYCASAHIDDTKIISPALDDRVGCYVMIEALKQIKNPKYDMYFVFTVQEELGLRGARTAVYSIDPEYGIAYDVTRSYDTPKCLKFPMKTGEGAAIKIKDSSVLCSRIIIEFLEKVAKANGIKHQFEILEGGGTDAGAMHISKSGVISGVISIVTRYIHSDDEMCLLEDIEASIALTVKAMETSI